MSSLKVSMTDKINIVRFEKQKLALIDMMLILMLRDHLPFFPTGSNSDCLKNYGGRINRTQTTSEFSEYNYYIPILHLQNSSNFFKKNSNTLIDFIMMPTILNI